MPSATRTDWLKKQIRYRDANAVLRVMHGVLRNWLMELEAGIGTTKRNKDSAVSLLRTQVQAEQLQSEGAQLELWPGRETPHGHAPDRVRAETEDESLHRRLGTISERLNQITLRWENGKWFLFAPMIEGFDREKQITVRRLVKIISDLEDEWAELQAARAARTRESLQNQLDHGWALMHVTRRGSRMWGRPLAIREEARQAVDALMHKVEEGDVAYEDVLRGEYIVAPVNWLDWSKGMDPETSADITDWLALSRHERRAFAGVEPEEVDRLGEAARKAVEQKNPAILIDETRTTRGALWQR